MKYRLVVAGDALDKGEREQCEDECIEDAEAAVDQAVIEQRLDEVRLHSKGGCRDQHGDNRPAELLLVAPQILFGDALGGIGRNGIRLGTGGGNVRAMEFGLWMNQLMS